MHDDTAFERQIGVVLHRMGGPEPTFDALAIARAAAVPSPRWRFPSIGSATRFVASATRFVVAGAIVSLFGGFLLMGDRRSRAPSESHRPRRRRPPSTRWTDS